jgi:large repetitive protein
MKRIQKVSGPRNTNAKIRSKSFSRRWLSSLLRSFCSGIDQRRLRRIQFEPLEFRQLMAADFYAGTNLLSQSSSQDISIPAIYSQSSASLSAEGEGEAGQNLVEFAKALSQAGVRFFGADWCPVCLEQKKLFGDGAQYLPFVEMTNPDRTRNQLAITENVTQYPTWEFPGGTRVTGLQTLQQLSTLANVPIPTNSNPTIVEIPNATVRQRAPLHIPVDAYNPGGGPLTITVDSSNPSVVSAELVSDVKSLRLSVNGYGDMVFRLFASEAPRPVGRIETLVNSGFYNQTGTNKIIFHRVVDNFVLQAGDPTGTGSGGSTLGNFDDQFDVDLQHNRTGILSYAKSSDDTNDSQFFITEGPQRHLDFNHSIFGQLIQGEAVREGISRTKVTSSKPDTEISIKDAAIFNDTENGLIRLKTNATSGTSTITVRVTNSTGQTFTRTFTATAAADDSNGSPFLQDITVPPSITAGQEATLQLQAVDKEGDAVKFEATKRGSVNYTFDINPDTGLLKVTPPSNYTGPLEIAVSATNKTGSTGTQDKFDTEILTFNVVASSNLAAPSSVTLASASDSGVSNTDGITNAGTVTLVVSGTVAGATVSLRAGNTVVGSLVATGNTTNIQTNLISQLGQGTHSIVAIQSLNGQTSPASSPVSITLDSVNPASIATNRLPTNANVGNQLQFDLVHPEEGKGLRYSLDSGPSGMTVNATTGLISWTPQSSQVGPAAVELRLTDTAGNFVVQQFSVATAVAARVRVQLLPFDLQGNALTSLRINQEFNLRVVVTDLRTGGDPDGDGVFSAYVDVEYDPALVELVGTNPFTLSNDFKNGPAIPDTSTPGILDELGGFSNFNSGPGRDPQTVGTIRMRAKVSGQALFTSNPAENQSRGFSVFKINGAVPSNEISFVSNTLNVATNFTVVNDTFNVNEDVSSFELNPLANDTTEGVGTTLTLQSVGTPNQGGTFTIQNNRLRYTPKANFNGVETVSYTVVDQTGAALTGTITVQVNPVNDPPVATADSLTARAGDVDLFLNVLANDTQGPDSGETLRVTVVGTPSQGGTAKLASNGTGILYTPKLGFTGTETVSYTISDGNGGTSTATVTINVGPAVPPPTVVGDAFNVQEDASDAEFNVLANDTPAANGDTLTVVSVQAPQGTASVTSNGTRVTYRPKANATGQELVTYTARSSNGGVATGTITFTIQSVNDAPDAVNDAFDVLSQPNQSIDVLKNDTNVDTGETYNIASVTQPPTGQGTVSISSNGKTILYSAPSVEFTGTVKFTYTINDGNSLTDTAEVTLTIQNFKPRTVGVVPEFGSVGGVNVEVRYLPTVGNTDPQTKTPNIVNNAIVVQNIGPGTVEFTVPKLPFRTQEAQKVMVTSSFNDGDSVTNAIRVGTRAARFIDLRDFMGQNLSRGLFTAVTPNQKAHWFESQGTWSQYKDIEIRLNSAGDQLSVNAKSPSNQNVQATLPITDNRVEVRAKDGGATLVRLRDEPTNVFTTNSASTSSTTGEGEGRNLNPQSVDQAMQQIRTNASPVPMDDIDAIAKSTVSNGYRRGFRTR